MDISTELAASVFIVRVICASKINFFKSLTPIQSSI
jgi:hypothetical protein